MLFYFRCSSVLPRRVSANGVDGYQRCVRRGEILVPSLARICVPTYLLLCSNRSNEYVCYVTGMALIPLTGLTELDTLDARLNEIRTVVQSLPPMNYDLLKRICEHLEQYVHMYSSTMLLV